MPVYDMRCPTGCGTFEDVVCRMAERHNQTCPECGEILAIVPSIGHGGVVGFTETRPLEIKQIGQTFTSNEQLKRYERENNVELHSSSSNYWQDYKARVREKCERTAKKQGFRDLDDKRSRMKQAKSEGRGVFQG